MKKIFAILCCLVTISAVANPGKRDTTFIRRPYYLGLAANYYQFMKPATLSDPSTGFFKEVYSGRSYGIVLAFPFLRRWECEAMIERVTWNGWVQSGYTYQLPNSNPPVTWEVSSSHWTTVKTWQSRMMFSYELFRKEKIALSVGGGGWLNMQELRNGPGSAAFELGLKCYYAPFNSSALQVGAYYGKTEMGDYVVARVAILLQGTRTYRVKPDKYYVRTYEEGE